MLKQTGLCFLVGALGAAACGGPSDNDYTGTPSAGHATSGGSSGSGGSSTGGSSATGGAGGSSKGGSGGSSKGGSGGGATGGAGGMGVGGTTDVGGSGGSTGGTDLGGTGGAMGGTGGDLVMGGTGGAMGGSGGDAGAGPSCDDLATAYAAALDEAKVCDPNSGKDQCTELVASSLNCGCDVYANPDNQEALDELTRLKKQGAKCAQICPAIACLPPEQGTCQQDPDGGDKEGHCLTASGPLPLR